MDLRQMLSVRVENLETLSTRVERSQMQIEWRRSKVAELLIVKAIANQLPEEYEKCLIGLTAITKEAWKTAHDRECYSMKLDLLTNATVVDEPIRFVSNRSKDKEKLKSSSSSTNEDEKEESNEPDYDEDKDQLDEEQEEETGEMTSNQVF
jgi:hypothetical protein